MTTATKADPVAEHAELAAKVTRATAEATALRHQHYAAQENYRALSDRRRDLAHKHPEMFKADMTPVKGSDAAALQAELDSVGKLDWSEEIARAERLQQLAEGELGAHRFENAEALAAALAQKGEAATAAFVDSLARVLDNCRAVQGVGVELTALCGALPGAIDGRDVQSDQAVTDLARELERLMARHEFTPPRSRSLTPVGEHDVRYVLGPKGDGYINASNAR